MAITYSYTNGSTANLDRLRFILGDCRGVPGTYATMVAWIDATTGAQAVFSDEELNDLLLSTMANGDIPTAARLALQSRCNREAISAGVSGTTDTSDRPAALINAIRQLERLGYPLSTGLPTSDERTNADLDTVTDMGDDA